MASSKGVTPDTISSREFGELLAQYSTLADSISASKGAKGGQKTLKELDHYRYIEAPGLFSPVKPKHPMSIDDVKVLVDWKLRHGTFRPTLMKLVSSNEPASVKSAVQEALAVYRKGPDLSATLKILTKLKGIGPATASLLLAVHYPEQVMFFSDEAFYWLCNKGQKESLKYNMKEYQTLDSEAQKLIKRLGVAAVDVERVAYVLMRQEVSAAPPTAGKASANVSKAGAKKVQDATAKRKKAPDDDKEDQGPVRRSKRGKGS